MGGMDSSCSVVSVDIEVFEERGIGVVEVSFLKILVFPFNFNFCLFLHFRKLIFYF